MFEEIATAAGIGADLYGSISGNKGVKQMNETNLKIARENNAFQERMSSTAYQRAAKDLESAGLNRVLAVGSPSSTPSGSMATMQNEKQFTPQAFSGVSAKLKAMEEMKLLREQQKSVESTTNLNNANARKASVEADQAEALKGIYTVMGPQIKELLERIPGVVNSVKDATDFGKLGSDYKRGLDVIGNKATELFEGASNSAKQVYQEAKDRARREAEKAGTKIRVILDDGQQYFQRVKDTLHDNVRNDRGGRK
ncbi:MAG: DNA pilot protein [Microviridae sp.]|nr:MAG: DNA pilot protein [Microviridae sp.]